MDRRRPRHRPPPAPDLEQARKFVGWRDNCESSIRNSYQILSRGTPNLENELWNVSAQVVNGTMKPEEAAKKVEDGLASWYEPHKK